MAPKAIGAPPRVDAGDRHRPRRRGPSYVASRGARSAGRCNPRCSRACMALIVQKYGGTSVGTVERIREVARRVASYRRQGHRLVVVVSAMAGETNRLLE